MARSVAAERGLRNRVLVSLSADDFELLRPHLVAAEFKLRMSMEEPDTTIEHVYFPESGIVSVVAEAARRKSVEVGLIGREGMTGVAIVLGDDRTSNHVYVQIAGNGHAMPAATLNRALGESPTLRASLLRYVQVFLSQTMATASANGQGKLEERLARWLLMAHDRVDGFSLPLTHEFIAMMLGVRRAGVTIAIQLLEGRSLIKALRREIVVRDRAGLERLAGQTYGTPEREMKRLFG